MLKPGLRVRSNNGISLALDVNPDTDSKRGSSNALPLMTGSSRSRSVLDTDCAQARTISPLATYVRCWVDDY
jgi:hypothetical protein